MEELVYYEKNVAYHVGVRMSIRDSIGVLLTGENPFVAVEVSHLKDFKLANKRAIIAGLIKPAEEPNLEWETVNTVTDEEVTDLLKNWIKLRKKVNEISSTPILYKFLNTAKEQNKSQKIMDLIKERLEDLNGEIADPNQMQSVTN